MKYIIGLIIVALVAGGAFVIAGRDGDQSDTSTSPPPPSSQTSNGDQNNTGLPEEANNVTISNLSFSPTDITVKRGTTVTWTNNDSVVHTIKFESGGFAESQTLENGDTHEITFNEVGTFNYICGIHPQMHGTVTVTE